MNYKKKYLLGVLLFLTCTVSMANPLATDQAFTALFSINRDQQPNGFGRDAPEDFVVQNNSATFETDLIDYLAKQKKLGANFNAYQHQGTLLHHAIRSHFSETAIWLLKNGANPTLIVTDQSSQFDAMGLAIHMGEWRIAKFLIKNSAYQQQNKAELATKYWALVPNAEKQNYIEMERLFGLPSFAKAPKLAQSLLEHGLCSHHLALVQNLLERSPALAKKHQLAKGSWVCNAAYAGNFYSAKPTPSTQDWPAWRAVEQKLNYPITAYLMTSAKGKMQGLLSAGLKSPWQNAQTLQQTLHTALFLNWEDAAPLIKQIPPKLLQNALLEKKLQNDWLKAAANWPIADLNWALEQVDLPTLDSEINTIMDSWRYVEATRDNAKNQSDRLQRWTLLTQRINKPASSKNAGFLYHLPIGLWSEWFKKGYVIKDDDWASWMRGANVNQLKQVWHIIQTYYPNAAKQSLTWLVAPISVGSIDDSIARQYSYNGYGYWSKNDLEVALFLHAQGMRVKQPRWLAAAFLDKTWLKENQPLVDLGLVRIPPETMRHAFEPVTQLTCKIETSSVIRRAITPSLRGKEEPPFGIQAIEFPNLQNCVWLSGKGLAGGSASWEEDFFFEGVQRFSPCGDGDYESLIWDNDQQQFTTSKTTLDGEVLPIRHKSSGQLIYISSQVDMGRCGTRAGSVYKAELSTNGKPVFNQIKQDDALFVDFALQCNSQDMVTCFYPDKEPWDTGNEQNWVNSTKLFEKDKANFFKALDNLDRTVLSKERNNGIFITWYNEAIQRVSDNPSWSVSEKRQRVAWLLAQRHLLKSIYSEKVHALAKWLPAEDWQPIIETYLCAHTYEFESLLRSEEKINPLLLQKLKKAQLNCSKK